MKQKTIDTKFGKVTIKRNKGSYTISTKYTDGGLGWISIPMNEYEIMKRLEKDTNVLAEVKDGN